MIFALRRAGVIANEYDSQRSDTEIVNFNRQFEAYAKDGNTFFDIITVANLAYDVNKKNGYDAQNSVEIRLENENNTNVAYSILCNANLAKNHFFVNENTGSSEYIYGNLVATYAKKKEDASGVPTTEYEYQFNCIGTKYNNVTGKVEQMRFKIVKN